MISFDEFFNNNNSFPFIYKAKKVILFCPQVSTFKSGNLKDTFADLSNCEIFDGHVSEPITYTLMSCDQPYSTRSDCTRDHSSTLFFLF